MSSQMSTETKQNPQSLYSNILSLFNLDPSLSNKTTSTTTELNPYQPYLSLINSVNQSNVKTSNDKTNHATPASSNNTDSKTVSKKSNSVIDLTTSDTMTKLMTDLETTKKEILSLKNETSKTLPNANSLNKESTPVSTTSTSKRKKYTSVGSSSTKNSTIAPVTNSIPVSKANTPETIPVLPNLPNPLSLLTSLQFPMLSNGATNPTTNTSSNTITANADKKSTPVNILPNPTTPITSTTPALPNLNALTSLLNSATGLPVLPNTTTTHTTTPTIPLLPATSTLPLLQPNLAANGTSPVLPNLFNPNGLSSLPGLSTLQPNALASNLGLPGFSTNLTNNASNLPPIQPNLANPATNLPFLNSNLLSAALPTFPTNTNSSTSTLPPLQPNFSKLTTPLPPLINPLFNSLLPQASLLSKLPTLTPNNLSEQILQTQAQLNLLLQQQSGNLSPFLLPPQNQLNPLTLLMNMIQQQQNANALNPLQNTNLIQQLLLLQSLALLQQQQQQQKSKSETATNNTTDDKSKEVANKDTTVQKTTTLETTPNVKETENKDTKKEPLTVDLTADNLPKTSDETVKDVTKSESTSVPLNSKLPDTDTKKSDESTSEKETKKSTGDMKIILSPPQDQDQSHDATTLPIHSEQKSSEIKKDDLTNDTDKSKNDGKTNSCIPSPKLDKNNEENDLFNQLKKDVSNKFLIAPPSPAPSSSSVNETNESNSENNDLLTPNAIQTASHSHATTTITAPTTEGPVDKANTNKTDTINEKDTQNHDDATAMDVDVLNSLVLKESEKTCQSPKTVCKNVKDLNLNDRVAELKCECRADTPISLNSLDLKEEASTDNLNSLDESRMNVDTPISLDSVDMRHDSAMHVDTPASLTSIDLKEESSMQVDTPISNNIKQEIKLEKVEQTTKPNESIVDTKKVIKENKVTVPEIKSSEIKEEKINQPSDSKEEKLNQQQPEESKSINDTKEKSSVNEKNSNEQTQKKEEEKTKTISEPNSTTESATSTTSTNKTHNPFILPQGGNAVPGKTTLPSLFLPNLLVPPLPNPMNSLNLLMPNIKPDLLPNPLAPALSNDLLMSSLNASLASTTNAKISESTPSVSSSTTAAKKPLISPLPTPPLPNSLSNPTAATNYTQSLLLGQNKGTLNPLQNLFTNSLGDLSNFKAPIFPLNMNLLVPKLNTTIKKPIKRKINQTNGEGELLDEKNDMESMSSVPPSVNNANTGSRKRSKYETDEKKRNVLERNRQAALKCRQKKKQWLISLQKQIDTYTAENETLQNQAILLQEEILTLRALLLTHKPCSINKNNDIINQSSTTPSPVNDLATYL